MNKKEGPWLCQMICEGTSGLLVPTVKYLEHTTASQLLLQMPAFQELAPRLMLRNPTPSSRAY